MADESPVLAKEIEVSFAEPEGRGAVTVHRSVVERGEGPLVVTGVRGFQYGSGNHQDNRFLFTVESPDVPVGKFLEDNPRLRDCLARVAEHPMNPLAHVALHFALRGHKSLYSQGCIDSDGLEEKLKGPDVRRVPLGAGEGELVVENSEGVQVGCGGTQHNEYAFRVVEAQLAIGAALASDWWLAAKFAIAMANPDTEAAQRSFTRYLVRAVGRVEGEISEVAGLRGLLADSIDQVDAVQAGTDNTRRDTAVVSGQDFRLVGWEEATGFEQERQRREEAEYLERDWEQRMAAKSEACDEDRAAEEATEPARHAVATLARAASEVTLSHVAPDREYLTDRMTTVMTSALVNVQPLEALPTGERAPSSGRPVPADSGADGVLDVRLVPLVPLEPGLYGSGPGTAVTPGSTPPPPPPALGAVAWGTVRSWDDPEGSLLGRAQAVVDYLRRQLWAGRAGNTPELVARALRAHRSLRAVLFLDPAAGEGLWVDVGPRGRAVAALLIRLDLSAELPGRFTVYGWAK